MGRPRRDFEAVAVVISPCQHRYGPLSIYCGLSAADHPNAGHKFEQPETVLVDFGGQGVIVSTRPWSLESEIAWWNGPASGQNPRLGVPLRVHPGWLPLVAALALAAGVWIGRAW